MKLAYTSKNCLTHSFSASWKSLNRYRYRVTTLTMLTLLCTNQAFGEPYYWYNNDRTAKFSSALAACNGTMYAWSAAQPARNPRVSPYTDVAYHCTWDWYYPFDGNWYEQGWQMYFVYRYGDSCGPDATADCDTQEQKGTPPALSCVGNPINIAIGNKYEKEDDYIPPNQNSREFSRYYNSVDGLWRHTYSAYLRFSPDKWALIAPDGKEYYFHTVFRYSLSGGSSLNQVGDTWEWVSETGDTYKFNSGGGLIGIISAAGAEQKITVVNGQSIVTDSSGHQLTFTEDAKHQPLSFSAGDLNIAYVYEDGAHLSQVKRTAAGITTVRQYLYEDTRNNGLLTGIIDERGVRFATWSYDAQWRAVSSEHAGGAQKTLVAYNADDSRTVTNELGKNTTYRFVTVGNVKRVSAIEGEPSANCPASNSTFTYNALGQMLTKTDAKGLVTTYSYNDRGLETSRTEASGTPLARTVTTEWDPVRYLKTKVVEPNRTTLYTYDAQGRTLSQQTTPN